MNGAYEGWGLLELMGHRQRWGRIQEVEAYGAKMLRIDVPAKAGDVTEFCGPSAIYSLRPCSEEMARTEAARYGDARPAYPLTYREHPTQPALPGSGTDDEESPF